VLVIDRRFEMIVFKTGRFGEPRCWYIKDLIDDDDGRLLVPTSRRLLLEVGTSSIAPYDDVVMFSSQINSIFFPIKIFADEMIQSFKSF
ncbi:MAG: hypothetical protein ACI90V_000237, partial [Bacillariaceae sp.]|jgi:hypothetical protein